MADCECQCAEGAPIGWRRIPGGGRGLPFGRPGFGGFGGGFGANNNNNNNNNNNSSSNNNASNNMMSALNSLLGLNSLGGISSLGGFGFPFGGLGGLPFGGFGPGGFPPPCGCPSGQDCCCSPGPCSCGPFPSCGPCPQCPPPDCQPCGSVRWKRFKIVAPDGRECCFPVAVPWWCCGDDDEEGAAGAASPTGAAEPISPPVETVEQVLRDDKPATAMSASQLLMQRYMIANPPRAFGRPADSTGGHAGRGQPLGELEIIDCPPCEDGEASPQFAAAMEEFQRNAVLIPSEET